MMMERIAALVSVCDEDERELVDKLICAAAQYVEAVVLQRAAKCNYAGRQGDELRKAVEEADRNRRSCHDTLIFRVEIANRICRAHGRPPLYTGGSARREYGDFAGALVGEMFAGR